MEKARRQRLKNQQALANASESRPEFDPEHNERSLVLNKSHKLSALYYRKARYKVFWGGRGSAKSWAFAEALIRLAAVLNIRVLCVREFQSSIRDSSHKILKDTIIRLGMESWFHVTKEGITSRAGAEFLFKGLHNNEQGIRSTEGVDICWVEEASAITETSWRVLIPTIRKPGSEFWVSFNMNDEQDATYQRLVVRQPQVDPELLRQGGYEVWSIVHKINYDENPYFPAVMRAEMEEDRERDFHLYEHIWLGMALKISNAIIFSGKYVVKEFSDLLWKQAQRLHFGADHGFAQDPATLIRFFPLERHKWNPEDPTEKAARRLFIEYEAYGTGVELDELPEFYDSVPGSRDWPIKADCARPETNSHLARKGFAISGAEKWEGCVKDGITHIRGFEQIVIHPRCTNTAAEARLYRYKTDPKQVDQYGQPQVLPIIVDKHNHCWDGIRYGLDGYIQRSGALGMWERLGAGAIAQRAR
jgi:phage terminase large subunit